MPDKKVVVEDGRTGMHPVTLERAVLDHLRYTCTKAQEDATLLDVYEALAHTVRDRLVNRWIETRRRYVASDVKRVYYLSAEFLLGRQLHKNLAYLGIVDTARTLLAERGISLDDVLEQEPDPGLGNGGLGRLAACFLDSMATLDIAGYGYGIRYEFGIFRQEMRDGWQVEQADAWLRHGCPWELPRHEFTVPVKFYGRVEHGWDRDGNERIRWADAQTVLGVPYDIPIAGYGTETVNTLRLWSARASRDFNLAVFNDGDYRHAVEEKALSESISKVLYPKDDSPEGRELRLKQQYFFVACSVADIIRRYKKNHDDLSGFGDKCALQLNDTHPAITVVELMRVLMDEEELSWEQAWEITRKAVAYTNHTLLAEALETWPVSMFERLLPRHLEIIYEMNHRFLREVHIHAPGDDELKRRMSLVGESGAKHLRMAHIAVVGSHAVNGVAALHSQLVKDQLLPDFARMYGDRFQNKTNGVTPRRWLWLCNPGLSGAITERIGDGWVSNLDELGKLRAYVDDAAFHDDLRGIKKANKYRLAGIVKRLCGFAPDCDSLFDVHVKRIHAYKRQLLNILHVVALYRALREDPTLDVVPRTFLFGGKAAPGYVKAKLHIKLIGDVAAIINDDPKVRDRLRVGFIPNYCVSLAERIIPAADISEQISMAGKEASGTGNMKFAMNGALTLGTLDGANIEIRDQVGEDHFFLFGKTAKEVRETIDAGYSSRQYIESSERLRGAIDLIASGFFCPDEPDRFAPVVDDLWNADTYLVCADFDSYCDAQERAAQHYRDPTAWTRSVVHNLAGVGMFSSDRTIRQYAREIWGLG